MHNCVNVLKDIIRERNQELANKNEIIEKMKMIEERLSQELNEVKGEANNKQ